MVKELEGLIVVIEQNVNHMSLENRKKKTVIKLIKCKRHVRGISAPMYSRFSGQAVAIVLTALTSGRNLQLDALSYNESPAREQR